MAEEKQIRILNTKTGAIKFVSETLAKNSAAMRRNGYVIHEIQQPQIESSGHFADDLTAADGIPQIKKRNAK